MDSLNRPDRALPVVLHSQSFDELKEEVGRHLGRVGLRQPAVKTFISRKIPSGFGGLVKAGEMIEHSFPISLDGSVQDIFTYLDRNSKDVLLQLTIVSQEGSQRIEIPIRDGFRPDKKTGVVKKNSVVLAKVINNSKDDIRCAVGFTFQEGQANETY
jgi:hypothetical protein